MQVSSTNVIHTPDCANQVPHHLLYGFYRYATHSRIVFPEQKHIRLSGLRGEDVGVTGIKDGHGGAPEELTASGTKLNL